MTDSDYAQEFDITVDEITDQYVAGELSQNERALVEGYFLKAEERREKVAFASALSRYAATSAPKPEVTPDPIKSDVARYELAPEPNFLDRLLASWAQSLVLRTAALLVLVAAIAFPVYRLMNPAQSYVTLALTMSNDTRGGNTTTQKAVLANATGLEVALRLPEGAQPADYRVALVGSTGTSQDIPIITRNPESLVVRVPASQLEPDTYAFKLFAINPDRSEQPINGSYLFVVEN